MLTALPLAVVPSEAGFGEVMPVAGAPATGTDDDDIVGGTPDGASVAVAGGSAAGGAGFSYMPQF